MAIRVVLAEDQAMVLGALAALLELEPDIEVIARAVNGRDALRAVEQLAPDVLVTDIEMPEMTGLEVAAALKISRPSVRTVILTTFARPGYLRRALDSGARGYLLKGPSGGGACGCGQACTSRAAGGRSWPRNRGLERGGRSTDGPRTADTAARGRRPFVERDLGGTAALRRGRCEIICRRRSRSWARPIAWMRRGSRERRGGCKVTEKGLSPGL